MGYSGNRDNWQFRYEVGRVREAAGKKSAEHREREAYWKQEAERAATAIRAAGVDVREYDITGGKRHEVVVDPALATRLGEAKNKWQQHQRQAEEYERWVRALEDGKPDDGLTSFLELKADDIEYFGL